MYLMFSGYGGLIRLNLFLDVSKVHIKKLGYVKLQFNFLKKKFKGPQLKTNI